MVNKKITEYDLLSRLEPGSELLAPLVVKKKIALDSKDRADARVELAWADEPGLFPFAVEVKTQSTPLVVKSALIQARAMVTGNEQPMILVPYLAPERLIELEKEKVSGVDLCGNGIVLVPGRLAVMRTGKPNRYPESRPLNNPYRGRSAMVARMLLTRQLWPSLKELLAGIQQAGGELSLSQASKAVQAMEDDLIVIKSGGAIKLREPMLLLDKLCGEWRRPQIRGRDAVRLPLDSDFASLLSSNPRLKWAVTGASSVQKYAMFSQGGPMRVVVSSLPLASTLINGVPESVPNFADLELVETEEAGFYFDNEVDENNVRWSSRLQTWLELQAGDARQQEAARDIRTQILKDIRL